MNKQIEEMAQDICEWYRHGVCSFDDKECDLQCTKGSIVEKLVNRGYRKASDVAREIFAEIEKATEHYISKIKEMEKNLEGISEFYGGAITASNLMLNIIAELKKKYEVTEE